MVAAVCAALAGGLMLVGDWARSADDVVVADRAAPGIPAEGNRIVVVNQNGVLNAANVHLNGAQLVNGFVNDDAVVVVNANKKNLLNINKQVDAWFFPRNQTEAKRAALEAPLMLRLAELRRCCNLSDAQAKKMTLAMQCDVSRFFDGIDHLRHRFLELGTFEQEIQQELIPLRAKYQNAELCGPDSFFEKSLTRLLDDDQLGSYRAVVDDRLRRRYLNYIDLILQELDQKCPLDTRQHETIRRLLIERLPPRAAPNSRTIGMLVQYRISQIPPEPLQQLFTDDQRIKFDRECRRFALNRDSLSQIGLLDDQ